MFSSPRWEIHTCAYWTPAQYRSTGQAFAGGQTLTQRGRLTGWTCRANIITPPPPSEAAHQNAAQLYARMEFDTWHDVVREYIDRGWTDGLPIIPPTPDMVAASLEAAGRNPSEVLGTEPTKGRVITAEKAAVNAVMAGCKPEYFKIVATAVEAMCEPDFNLHAVTASTQGAAILAIVNGPIANEVGLNSSVSIFGPGHTANATIGRALRLIIINATGSVSGEIDKATQGHPGKYTWCIAEAGGRVSVGTAADR